MADDADDDILGLLGRLPAASDERRRFNAARMNQVLG